MKFFRPEDFEMQKFSPKQAADFANNKLEKAALKVKVPPLSTITVGREDGIIIYKIEKCNHNNVCFTGKGKYFKCECGADLIAETFKEI